MAKELSREMLDELIKCFELVEDPRVKGRSKHLLINIIVITICALLCGAESVTDIAEFGLRKFKWLKKYLDLSAGVPSHDTIARVLSIVDPSAMEIAFSHWVETIAAPNLDSQKSISIDGKSVKGTERDFRARFKQLHLVSVFSHDSGLVLAQSVALRPGQGESTGAHECLEILDLKNTTVMSDAGLANKDIALKVRERGGHYMFPIKGNNKYSIAEIRKLFELHQEELITISKEDKKAHGRRESRTCSTLPKNAEFSTEFKKRWRDVETVFSITRTRTMKDINPLKHFVDKNGKRSARKNTNKEVTTTETTFYVTSRKLNPAEALAEVRKHWKIENNLHWVLDVAFNEDDWTVRAKDLARSISVLRKVAFNLIKQSATTGSVRVRLKRAAWDNDFLAELIFGRKGF